MTLENIKLDIDYVRSQFPAFNDPLTKDWSFFENAGGSYVPKNVIDKLTEFMISTKVQPYAEYSMSKKAGENMDKATKLFAQMINAKENEILIGGSTSINLYVLSNALKTFINEGDEIIVTNQDHEANISPWRRLKENGAKIVEWKFNVQNQELQISDLEKLINNKTKILYIESPGSLNYEVLDIKEIVKLCKKKKIITIMDNTWSTFLGCNPLEIGVDIVIESLTKYFSGHSDNFLGLIVLNSNQFARTIKTTSVRLGDYVSSESCFHATKGLKTLKLRIEKHIKNADKIFNYLKSKKIVKEILYLPDYNNKFHNLWKKYHKQSNGLITFSIQKKKNINVFIDKLNLFKIGFSWGGYESLIIPINNLKPTKKLSKKKVYWFRIHVGLESSSDLINDLEKAFENYER